MNKAILLLSAAIIGASTFAIQGNAQGAAQPADLTRVDVRTVAAGYQASTIIGSTVLNDTNETIGVIDDLLLTKEGKEPYVVLSVGGFLGMGERLVVVRYDSLKFATRNKILLPGGSRDGLRMLPAFEYKKD